MAKYIDSNGLSHFMTLIKSYFVSDVSWDSTNKKIQKTKGGTTSDVVALSTGATSGSYNDLSNKPSAYSLPTATNSTKGGVQLSDATNGTETAASGGKAATPKAVADALQAAKDYADANDSDTTYSDFTGATSSAAGAHGLVPAPASGEDDEVLRGNGSWSELFLNTSQASGNLNIMIGLDDGVDDVICDTKPIPAATTSNAGAMSATDKTKLDGIAAGAEVNVQSDWNQTTTTADDYIKNKPTIPTVPNPSIYHAVCSTAASTSAKTATLDDARGFSLTAGVVVAVTFDNGNSASSATLNINSTGAKNFYIEGRSPSSTSVLTVPSMNSRTTLLLTFNGTEWIAYEQYASLQPIAWKTVGAASGDIQENGSALSASKAVVTDANKKFISSSYSLGSACAKTVGAASGNLQENGAALSASKAVVTDANKKFVSSSYTLGAACEKGLGSVADGNTGLVTGDQVYDAIQTSMGDVAGALVYKGTLGATNGSVSSLPNSHTKGYYYIVADAGTYAGKVCEPGDMIICNTTGSSANNAHWDVIQTNIETLTNNEIDTLWTNA